MSAKKDLLYNAVLPYDNIILPFSDSLGGCSIPKTIPLFYKVDDTIICMVFPDITLSTVKVSDNVVYKPSSLSDLIGKT